MPWPFTCSLYYSIKGVGVGKVFTYLEQQVANENTLETRLNKSQSNFSASSSVMVKYFLWGRLPGSTHWDFSAPGCPESLPFRATVPGQYLMAQQLLQRTFLDGRDPLVQARALTAHIWASQLTASHSWGWWEGRAPTRRCRGPLFFRTSACACLGFLAPNSNSSSQSNKHFIFKHIWLRPQYVIFI